MAEEKTLEVFTTPTCGFCKALKEFLGEQKVNFKNYNVAEDEDRLGEMQELSGQSGVPVVLFNRGKDDEEVIVGFDQEKISKLLGINN